MRIGPFRTGNDYNFKPEKVKLFTEGRETRESLKQLNKIEIRYNTRKHLPSYPAMKSLYKWRSVFGYRLGGLIRRSIVKFSELNRHKANYKALSEGLKDVRKLRQEALLNPPEPREKLKSGDIDKNKIEFESKELNLKFNKLDDYVRKYSSRDVAIAMKKFHPEQTERLKYLKYMKWSDHSDKTHLVTAENDFSLRKLVMDEVVKRNLITESVSEWADLHEDHLEILKQENIENEKIFNENKEADFEKHLKRIIEEEAHIDFHNERFAKKNLEKNQQKTDVLEKNLPKIDVPERQFLIEIDEKDDEWQAPEVIESNKDIARMNRFIAEKIGDHYDPLILNEHAKAEPKHVEELPKQEAPQDEVRPTRKRAKDMTREELVDNYPDLREINARQFKPKESIFTKETFEKAIDAEKTEKKFGGISRLVHGVIPIGKIKRAGRFISFKLGLGARSQNAIDAFREFKQEKLEHNRNRPPETTREKVSNALNWGGGTFIKAFFETRHWRGHTMVDKPKVIEKRLYEENKQRLHLDRAFYTEDRIDNDLLLKTPVWEEQEHQSLRDALEGIEFGRAGESGAEVGKEKAFNPPDRNRKI